MGLLTDPPVPEDFTGTRATVCNLCEAICGVEISFEGGEITGIRGNDADPLSRGYICPKGVSLADVYHDPDRLKRPVRRIPVSITHPDGSIEEKDEWVEVPWREAYDLVADSLADVVDQHGNDAVGVYLGNPSVHSLGNTTHGIDMFKTLRTRNRFSASTVDQIPHQFVAWQLYGHQLLLPIPDIDRTQLFVVFGANPMASNGSLMTVPDFPNRLRALQERGGRMVVFDPRRTETAKRADEHHFVRPGTDAVVLLAMLQVLTSEGLTRPAAYLDHADELAELVAEITPERAEAISGVGADVIRRTARDLAGDKTALYGRLGVSTQEFGSICQWAIAAINALTGNLDHEGGLLFTEPAIDAVGKGLISRGAYDRWRSRVSDRPEFAGELPVSVLAEEIRTPGEGQIRALVTSAGNPVLSTPDGATLSEALTGLDFMVSVDFYINETTRHADIILPPASHLERDHYDLVFHGLAVRNTSRYASAVIEKEPGARHDWEIFGALQRRLSKRLRPNLSKRDRAVEVARTKLRPSAIIAGLLAANRKVSMRQLKAHPEGVDLGPLRPTLPGRLQTKDRRIDLTPELLVADLDRFRSWLDAEEQEAEGSAENDELLLIGRRHKQDCNSWMHNTSRLTKGRPRHHLLMHPSDVASRGVTDGARVRVSSRVGSVEVEVLATDEMMPGVVSLPHGYGHQVPGTRMRVAAEVSGVSINDLTDPEILDVSGNAALSGVRVKVTPV